MSNGKTRWAIYCETLATKPYDLTLNLPTGVYEAEWVDAKTGKSIQKMAVVKGVVRVPAGVADRVVLVRRK